MTHSREISPPLPLSINRPMGIGLVLLAALFFSLSTVLAAMSLKDGINVHVANAVRTTVAVVLLFVFLKMRRNRNPITRRQRLIALGLGVTVFMVSVGYLGAVRYIPVSFAVLIFYTFPFLIALAARFVDREPFTAVKWIALLTAFAGLMLVLGVKDVGSLNWPGIGLAFMAAVGSATLIMAGNRLMQQADAHSVTFYCLLGGAILLILSGFTVGELSGSETPRGWLLVCLAGLCQGTGYIMMFSGIRIVGPLLSGMLLNTEPLLTIPIAIVLLGEVLTMMQGFGALLVVAGILLISRRG